MTLILSFEVQYQSFDVAGTHTNCFDCKKIINIFIVGRENVKNNDSVFNIYASRYFQTTTQRLFVLLNSHSLSHLVRLLHDN